MEVDKRGEVGGTTAGALTTLLGPDDVTVCSLPRASLPRAGITLTL